MVETDTRIKVTRELAEKADRLVAHESFDFQSRNEVFRYVLREYLVDLTKAGIVPPEILRKL